MATRTYIAFARLQFSFISSTKLNGTRRAAVDGYASDCCDLWPFDPISMSQAHVRTWPNFNWSKYLWRYCITRFIGSLPAVTLTFWPQKLISTSMNPSTFVTIIGRNSFIDFRDIVFTRFLGHCLMWSWRLTFWPQKQKIIGTYEPKCTCDRNWVKFPLLDQ